MSTPRTRVSQVTGSGKWQAQFWNTNTETWSDLGDESATEKDARNKIASWDWTFQKRVGEGLEIAGNIDGSSAFVMEDAERGMVVLSTTDKDGNTAEVEIDHLDVIALMHWSAGFLARFHGGR